LRWRVERANGTRRIWNAPIDIAVGLGAISDHRNIAITETPKYEAVTEADAVPVAVAAAAPVTVTAQDACARCWREKKSAWHVVPYLSSCGHDSPASIRATCGFSVRWCDESICVICGPRWVRHHRELQRERGAGRQLGRGRL